MNKRKTERYGAVERTFEIKLDKPQAGLRAVKVLVAVLLVAVVIGAVVFGAYLYRDNSPDRRKASKAGRREG